MQWHRVSQGILSGPSQVIATGPGGHRVKRVLFLCGKNRLRSPTAEQIFAARPDLDVTSAGLSQDADIPVTPELLIWAEIVFVMERVHRQKLSARFQRHLKGKKVICLDIPDDYEFMDPKLILLLQARVPRHLSSESI